MLPVLFGLLGSGLAGTSALGGIAAGLSPLAAGAIGSGLGSFIETGDLGEGIKSGLMSFAGGKLLGSMMGGAGKDALMAGTAPAATGATPAAAATGVAPAVAGATPTGAVGATAGGAPAASLRPMLRPEGLGTAATASAPAAGGIMDIGRRGMEFARTPAGMGASVGSALAPGLDLGLGGGSSESTDEKREVPGGRDLSGVRFPSGGMGGSAEFDYNFPGPYVAPATETATETAPTAPTGAASSYLDRIGRAGGGSLRRYARPSMMGMETKLAAGGLADLAEAEMMDDMPEEMSMDMPMEPPQESSTAASPNDKEIIVSAVKAIKSGTPDDMNKVALADFVRRFGEDALMDLVDSVQRGDFDDIANANEGLIKGPGDAMEDLVPAKNTENGEDILLSGEEFIVPGDVVSGLGNGSSEAGADELYKMMDRVRVARTGTTEQPPQIKAGGLLPA